MPKKVSDIDFFADIIEDVKVETFEDQVADHIYWAHKSPEEIAEYLEIPVEKITQNKKIKKLLYEKDIKFHMGLTKDIREGNVYDLPKSLYWAKHKYGMTDAAAERKAEAAQIANQAKMKYVDASPPLSLEDYTRILKETLEKE